jgi:hypothetical protein
MVSLLFGERLKTLPAHRCAVSRHKSTFPESTNPGQLPDRGCVDLDVQTALNELLDVDRLSARAIQQFDVCHRRIIARTETALENAQITAGTLAVTRAQLDE